MKKYFRMELENPFPSEISPTEFRIVAYSPSLHHNKIPSLYWNCFKEKSWDNNWDSFPEFDPNGVFLAIDNKTTELTGLIVSFKRKGFGYISVVAVVPKWRRKGVASSLLKTVINRFHSLNIKTVKIDAETMNPSAVNLYKKTGFTVGETLED